MSDISIENIDAGLLTDAAYTFGRRCMSEAYGVQLFTSLPEDQWREAGRFIFKASDYAKEHPHVLVGILREMGIDDPSAPTLPYKTIE